MRFSLLNRFIGGLISYLVGVTLKAEGLRLPANESQSSSWLNAIILMTNRLLESSTLKPEDCLEIYQQYGYDLQLESKFNMDVIALLTTPLGLFFHDHPLRLQKELEHCLQTWQQPSEALESVLIWHQAIALIIREKAQPSCLISQILAFDPEEKTALSQQLKQIQPLLAVGSCPKSLISQLSSQSQPDITSLILAFYYFSQTPEDFRLCVLRAQKSSVQPLRITGLTAILAGVYNSWSGIPIEWRLELQNNQTAQIIHQQAIRLLALWSGVIQPIDLNSISEVAIASPKVIQPRSCLNIVSQKNL
jgi:hypothetical protein